MDIKEVVRTLQGRSSVGPKYLSEPAPAEEQYLEAVKCALAVPDPRSLHPCRVVLVNDRKQLAGCFEAGAVDAGADQEQAAKARSKALKAPAIVAIIVRINEDSPAVPPFEQWMTCGAFLMNFMTVLELQGFGAKVVTGTSTRYRQVTNALCKEGEIIACWVMIGTPTEQRPTAPKREEAADFFSVF